MANEEHLALLKQGVDAWVVTEMLRQAAPQLKAGMTPDDLARILFFLTSDDAQHLSGVNIPIFSNA